MFNLHFIELHFSHVGKLQKYMYSGLQKQPNILYELIFTCGCAERKENS